MKPRLYLKSQLPYVTLSCRLIVVTIDKEAVGTDIVNGQGPIHRQATLDMVKPLIIKCYMQSVNYNFNECKGHLDALSFN